MNTPLPASDLMNVQELSRYLNVPVATLYNWVYFRKIPFIKLGGLLRFRKEEINEFVRQRTIKPAGKR